MQLVMVPAQEPQRLILSFASLFMQHGTVPPSFERPKVGVWALEVLGTDELLAIS